MACKEEPGRDVEEPCIIWRTRSRAGVGRFARIDQVPVIFSPVMIVRTLRSREVGVSVHSSDLLGRRVTHESKSGPGGSLQQPARLFSTFATLLIMVASPHELSSTMRI